MAEPVPAYAQMAYAVLHAKFGLGSFSSDYLGWFASGNMAKKTLHALEKAGWIARVERGVYKCVGAEDIFKSMVEFKVPEVLEGSGMRYAYADASAAEIWTDYTYMQRSWEHSPYYIRVLDSELNDWGRYLRSHKVKVFVEEAKPAFGEFVVLEPQQKLVYDFHDGMKVERLEEVVK